VTKRGWRIISSWALVLPIITSYASETRIWTTIFPNSKVSAEGYEAQTFFACIGPKVSQMARDCSLITSSEVTAIHPEQWYVSLASGKKNGYERLISTLPLHATMELAGLSLDVTADPFTSVLVLNIGGTAGPSCPDHHWLYIPHTEAGFHRVGFYSNVDSAFAPAASAGREHISIYVEKAFRGGETLADDEVETYKAAVIAELRQWGYLDEVDVIDPIWVPVAYTWSWPGSIWRERAIAALAASRH